MYKYLFHSHIIFMYTLLFMLYYLYTHYIYLNDIIIIKKKIIERTESIR